MEIKHLIIGFFGMLAMTLTAIPLWDLIQSPEKVLVKATSVNVNDLQALGQEKLDQLNMNPKVNNCWQAVSSIFKDGTWYDRPLSINVEKVKDSCL